MAFSAHKDEESIKEHFEDAKSIEKKATELVALIKAAKRVVFFTGAGISTSAGIPDFRGPDGVWTLQAQGKSRTGPTVSTTKAMPTATHMSLVELQNRGILTYLISQNCDGLHRRSGILPEKISELHGNTNLEYCSKCKKEYLRDYSASASYRFSVHDHRTGRMCVAPGCGAPLLDSIINFGENLPEVPLERASQHSKNADLHIVLGSSLTVSPACNLPKSTAKHGGKLVICNLQNTPLDPLAHMRIYCRTDDLMRAVMEKLSLPIPRFVLSRRIILSHQHPDAVTLSGSPSKKETSPKVVRFELRGVDVDGTSASIIAGLQLHVNGVAAPLMEVEPFVFELEDPDADLELRMKCYWHGHYNEPPLTIVHKCKSTEKPKEVLLKLAYDPLKGEWAGSADEGAAVAFEQQPKKK